jgi:hypothetical protein
VTAGSRASAVVADSVAGLPAASLAEVETKRQGPIGEADVALRSLGLRPIELSKYCLAVALLHPGIRANPWHRTLQRYFADTTRSAPSRHPQPGF